MSCSYTQQCCPLFLLYTHLYTFILWSTRADTLLWTCRINSETDISPWTSNDCRAHYDCWLPAARLLSFTENDAPPNNIEQHMHTLTVSVCVHYRDKTICERGLLAKRIMLQHCYPAPQGLSFCGRWNINKGLHSCGSEIGIWKETQKADRLSCVVIWRKSVSMYHLITPQSHFS